MPKNVALERTSFWSRIKISTNDLVAGVTGALTSIPDAMASAVIAGVSPAHGLYSYIFGTPLAGLTSSSVLVCAATTSALSLLTKSALIELPQDSLSLGLVTLVFLVGLFQLIFGLLRLGFLTYYVSNAVMTGFLTGVSLLILFGTLPDLLGYKSKATGNVFKLLDLFANPREIKTTIAVVGACTIISLLAFDRLKLKKVSSILALITATLAALVIGGQAVPSIGSAYEIPRTLPTLQLPNANLLVELAFPAFAIAAIGLIQAAGVSQSTPNPDGSYPSVSRDFTAQGLGNLACGFAGGLPIGGSLSATAMMRGAGAQNRWANVSVGAFMAISLMALAPLIRLIPLVAVDGLLFVFVARSLNYHRFVSVWKTNWFARSIMLASLIATLFLRLDLAVLLSMGLSFVLHILRSSQQVRIVRLKQDKRGIIEEAPPRDLPDRETVVLSVYGSLFFAGARIFETRLPSPDHTQNPEVILSLRGRQDVGSTFIGAIDRYARRLHAHQGRLILAGVDERVMDQLTRTHAIEVIGRENIFPATAHLGESLQLALKHCAHDASKPDVTR